MIVLSDYYKEQALNPKWNEASRVHDWRNYISEEVKFLWDTFSDVQKFAIMKQADNQANQEVWD